MRFLTIYKGVEQNGTRQFLDVAGDGECEVRELYDAPAFDRAQQPT